MQIKVKGLIRQMPFATVLKTYSVKLSRQYTKYYMYDLQFWYCIDYWEMKVKLHV